MKQSAKFLMLACGVALSFFAQQPPRSLMSFRWQAASTVSLAGKADEQTLEIRNATYEVTGDFVPGGPRGERLLLRQTTDSKQALGEKGVDGKVRLEAWPLGADPKEKPLYTIEASGSGGHTIDSALFVADRGLEEVEWWSVYRLGDGRHLFDTHVPLVRFSISKEVMEMRYVGLEIPPDEAHVGANVVAFLIYASEQQVKRRVLISCDDAKQASLLRSYADTGHSVRVSDEKRPQTLQIAFEPYGVARSVIVVPMSGDDLDIARSQMPRGIRMSAMK